MTNEETLEYINLHRLDNPKELALKGHPGGVDIRYALEQIAGFQAARRKLPQWAATEGVIFPPHISMEQCSSQATAEYKRQTAQRLLGGQGGTLIDITGGYGVDFTYMARAFRHAIYVERQEVLCRAAIHNMPLLGHPGAEIVCADGTEYIAAAEHAAMVFIDPARRDRNGGRTYALADCTPDATALMPMLREKADFVMLKLSPMLDWHKAAADIGRAAEVHIVSVRNQCKELLVVADCRNGDGEGGDCRAEGTDGLQTRIFCANLNEDGTAVSLDTFSMEEISGGTQTALATPEAGMHIYEPNASIMKAGGLGALCGRYGVRQVAVNSNLFVSEKSAEDFPGRHFVINSVSGMNKKELRQSLSTIKKANITTRNFPLQAEELRRRLKLKDGGSTYIFATTIADGSHRLIICEPTCRE